MPDRQQSCSFVAVQPILRFAWAWLFLVFLVALIAPGSAWPQQPSNDLTSQSLEDLMNIQVTSATKKAENLSGAPAAIFVVTGEDIRRGGFSSIPDALRTVPGLHVAQQSAHAWIVAARGFSSVFNDKMLVLIDGKLVYDPLFGGVWWDVQDPPLEDIDRIEVIRGPGGTLWGANAVNGVINIITKKAGDTQGSLVTTSAGVNEGYAARARYGGSLGTNLEYRIYGSSSDWLPSVNPAGVEDYDSWSLSQGGIRADWRASPKDTVSFDATGYSGRVRDPITVLSPVAPPLLLEKSGVVKGGHLLGRWTHKFSDRSSTDLLGYCDWNSRNTEKFIELRNTCDVQFQHNYAFTDRHSLTWGGEVLTTSSTQEHDFTVNFIPASERDTASSLFLQYELVVIPSKLRIVAGSKFGNNSFTGFEYQPQVRAVWSLRKNQNFWGAVSRVVAVPNQSQRSIQAPLVELSPVPPTFLIITGNPNLSAEVEHAFETGYRYERKDKVSFDGAIYYNHFYHLIGNVAEPPLISFSPFYVNIPSRFSNLGPGQTHGLELEIKYAPVRRWSLSTAITELRGNSVPGLGIPAVSADPRHMVSVQSRLDLTRLINFDCGYYYYDAANSLPPVNRVDVGGSTKSVRGFTFSVWGRNLQTARHQEASDLILPFGDVRRSVTFKLTWESKTEQKSPSP